MSTDPVLVSVDAQGVARLTLNRPERHNAMSPAMIAGLRVSAAALDRDPDVRAVVITGAGRSFCAGADLDWMRTQFAADRATRLAEARALAHMLRDLNTLSKPLIGRINGTAMGGGLGLMAICDVAIAADTGKFGFTETRLGLVPATIAPYVLARMGEGAARRVFMNGAVFGADTLPALGLVARVVPQERLDVSVAAEVAPYLAAVPEAVADAKRLARRLGPTIDDALIEETIECLAACWERPEAAARIASFLGRRKTLAPRG